MLYFNLKGGVPIRYGRAEPWKVIAQQIGQTKPSRAPKPEESKRKKNDGRPPDTAKELLGKSSKHKAPTVKNTKHYAMGFALQSYPWSKNSCWLDSSLNLLYRAISRDFPDFSKRFQGLNTNMALKALFSAYKL